MGCSPTCPPACPCKYAPWFPRVAFGLVLVSYGVNHYRHLTDFVGMTKGIYGTAPVIPGVAGALAYVVPALMIVGGLLFAIKQMCCISKICILAALSGVIGWASLAVFFGDAAIGGAAMPLIQNAALLIVFYWVIKKMSCCGSAYSVGATKACPSQKVSCACSKK